MSFNVFVTCYFFGVNLKEIQSWGVATTQGGMSCCMSVSKTKSERIQKIESNYNSGVDGVGGFVEGLM